MADQPELLTLRQIAERIGVEYQVVKTARRRLGIPFDAFVPNAVGSGKRAYGFLPENVLRIAQEMARPNFGRPVFAVNHARRFINENFPTNKIVSIEDPTRNNEKEGA